MPEAEPLTGKLGTLGSMAFARSFNSAIGNAEDRREVTSLATVEESLSRVSSVKSIAFGFEKKYISVNGTTYGQ